MIELKLADPTPHELAEYRVLINQLNDKFPDAEILVERGDGDYAISNTAIFINDDKRTNYHSAIYPSVPNRGTAQIKADILALTFAMRELGFDIKSFVSALNLAFNSSKYDREFRHFKLQNVNWVIIFHKHKTTKYCGSNIISMW